MEIIIEEGFVVADNRNIPNISSEMLFSLITNLIQTGTKDLSEIKPRKKYNIDFVQIKIDESVIMKAILYTDLYSVDDINYIAVNLDLKNKTINSTQCIGCDKDTPCEHIIEFLFWLHRESNMEDADYKMYWNVKSVTDQFDIDDQAVLLKNAIPPIQEHYNDNSEDDVVMITPEEGDNFLQLVLDEMEKLDLTDLSLYSHCRPIIGEFEPLYIHHTMLDAANNDVRDFKSFILYMEEVSNRGLFSRIAEESSTNYKRKLWMETQYCRIRCSLMYSILTRQDKSEDDAILEAIFCRNREERIKERKNIKEHKRFILKQTEKLENKEYKECGLLISEIYPYICASPDGITDDHVVEIKVPKTEEEFEKYLVGKETIAPKYMAQMQIQMYLANVQKALYCVLSPKFETNGAMHYVWVQAELQQIANLLSEAEDYWKEVVFPEIKKIYLEE